MDILEQAQVAGLSPLEARIALILADIDGISRAEQFILEVAEEIRAERAAGRKRLAFPVTEHPDYARPAMLGLAAALREG